MMEMLPPVGSADVATKRDLDQLRELLEYKIENSGLRVRADFESAMRRPLAVLLSALFSVAGILTALPTFGPHARAAAVGSRRLTRRPRPRRVITRYTVANTTATTAAIVVARNNGLAASVPASTPCRLVNMNAA